MLVDKNLLYLNRDSRIAALDVTSGAEKWAYKPDDDTSVQGENGVMVNQHVRVRVFVGKRQQVVTVKGLRIGSGTISIPTIAGGVLYFTSVKGLHAVHLATRSELWRLPIENLQVQRPVVADGVIYVGTTAPATGATANQSFGLIAYRLESKKSE